MSHKKPKPEWTMLELTTRILEVLDDILKALEATP